MHLIFKTNELNDTTLDRVTGGTMGIGSFGPIVVRPTSGGGGQGPSGPGGGPSGSAGGSSTTSPASSGFDPNSVHFPA